MFPKKVSVDSDTIGEPVLAHGKRDIMANFEQASAGPTCICFLNHLAAQLLVLCRSGVSTDDEKN